MSEPSFGFVINTVPRGFDEEVMARPAEATRALLAAIEQAMEVAWPAFDTLWVEDHLQWGNNRPVLEAMTALTYLAGRHEGWRFGTIVLAQSFRNPALLAKMAAVLQALTGGRLILGIGAGWKEDEYRAYGYPYPADRERVDQLEEAVQLLRAMWTTSPATFIGRHYRVEDAECQPLPDPPIPLLIAGAGERKTLRIAAQHGDWWSAPVQSIAEYAHKMQVVAEHCQALDRDPATLTPSFAARVSIVERSEDFERTPGRYIIGGTPDMVAAELQQLIDIGVRHFHLSFLDFPSLDGLQRFVADVIPRLKS